MFDTKVALIVRDDLAAWQKLNVVAFLATGVAAEAPEALGEPYEDAAGRRYGRMLGQPMLVFSADLNGLQAAHRQRCRATIVPYVRDVFDRARRGQPRRVSGRRCGESRLRRAGAARAEEAVDKAVKGLALHA